MTRRLRVGLVAVLAALGVAGCGGGRSGVSGTVTVNGEPVDAGAITFTPADGSKERPSAGATIADGKYAIDAERGPAPGNYKVEITWNKKTGKKVKDTADTGEIKDERKQVLGPEHNTATTHTFEIKSGANAANFELKATLLNPTGSGAGSGAGSKKGTAVGD